MTDSKKSIPYDLLDLKLERNILIKRVIDAVKYARSIGEPVRVYRFGFFRLQFVPTRLVPGHSLHVWSKELAGATSEAPHNHNSYMQSRVLLGKITNRFWDKAQVDDDGIWRPTETICTDTVCEDRPADYRVSFKLLKEESFGPKEPMGDYYEMRRGSIHSSEFTAGTVTLIHKSNIDPKIKITNMLRYDQPPKLEGFDITSYPQEKAWAEVNQAVKNLIASTKD